jgi:hypothetical protein
MTQPAEHDHRRTVAAAIGADAGIARTLAEELIALAKQLLEM